MQAGDRLGDLLAASAPADLAPGDVLAISHKAVSKAEGRTRRLGEIEPGRQATDLGEQLGKDPRLVQAVLDEAVSVLRAERGVLICETRGGLICANAGVDRSNAPDGELILLPEDPDASARTLRAELAAACGVAPAVVVADSFGRPWRHGQTDVAIGAAGLRPLDDWRGLRDAGGRELSATSIAVADAVAAAADLARAKDSAEPVVLVRGLQRFVTEADGPGAAALRRPRAENLFL